MNRLCREVAVGIGRMWGRCPTPGMFPDDSEELVLRDWSAAQCAKSGETVAETKDGGESEDVAGDHHTRDEARPRRKQFHDGQGVVS